MAARVVGGAGLAVKLAGPLADWEDGVDMEVLGLKIQVRRAAGVGRVLVGATYGEEGQLL